MTFEPYQLWLLITSALLKERLIGFFLPILMVIILVICGKLFTRSIKGMAES